VGGSETGAEDVGHRRALNFMIETTDLAIEESSEHDEIRPIVTANLYGIRYVLGRDRDLRGWGRRYVPIAPGELLDVRTNRLLIKPMP
jgi:hypothetical protein